MKNLNTSIPKEKDTLEKPGPAGMNQELFSLAGTAKEQYNAFITLEEQALEFSEVEKDKSPLSGVPAVLADNLCTEEIRTTCGSKILENYRPPFGAFAAERLKDAGAVIMGKANVDEFGVGDSRGISYFGPCKNPWDINRTAGSGTACAVALGAAVFGLGSDARGGLRQSAAYCGLAGMKPGYGRVSRWGLIDYAPSLDQISIAAKTAADIALVLECIAGEDYRDPSTLNNPAPSFVPLLEEKAAGTKIGLLKGWDQVESIEPQVKELFEKGLSWLKDIGCSIVEVDLPDFFNASAAACVIGAVEAFSSLANYDGVRFGFRSRSNHLQEMYIETRTEAFSTFLKKYLTFGALASSEKHFQDIFLPAQKVRTKIKEQLKGVLKTVDMVASPTVPFCAPLFSDLDSRFGLDSSANLFTAAANLAGNPAVTIPIGSDDGLPAGLQLIGRFFEEGNLLKILNEMEG